MNFSNQIFKYKQKRVWLNLVLGLVWLIFGVFSLLFNENDFLPGWQILFSVFYFGLYFFNKKYNYIALKDNVLKSYIHFKKTIDLTKLERVKFFAGEYTIYAKDKKLVIALEGMELESKFKFKALMDELQKVLVLN